MTRFEKIDERTRCIVSRAAEARGANSGGIVMAEHTPGPWRTEAVSDAVRVVSGSGRTKIILARCAPPQIPEAETHANARLMAAAPDLYDALDRIVRNCRDADCGDHCPNSCMFCQAHAAIAKAKGA
jgi:hypothetical protein